MFDSGIKKIIPPHSNKGHLSVVLSEMDKIKPNKDIYLIAIKRYKLNPTETVFIDDNFDNIKTANQLGFKTIHLVDPNQIKKEIYKYLI